MWAVTLFPFLGNFWFRKLVNPLEAFGALCHVVFFVVSIVTLVVLAPRSTNEFVFGTLTRDVSGWTNPAVAWGLGLLTVTFPLTGGCSFPSFSSPSSNVVTDGIVDQRMRIGGSTLEHHPFHFWNLAPSTSDRSPPPLLDYQPFYFSMFKVGIHADI